MKLLSILASVAAIVAAQAFGDLQAADPPPSVVEQSAESRAARKYSFSPDDERLLNEIQYGCFRYFWQEVGSPVPIVRDRLKGPVSSIAAVGFQLSSLPIGVERGWITREQGARRAAEVLRGMIERTDNKRFGVYLHFPDLNTGGLSHEGYDTEVSTVDTALFMAGAITAASYFGGPVNDLTDRLIKDTNWRAFAVGPKGFLSMGWKPDDPEKVDGPGKFIDWHWYNASDEERLVYLLAAGAPNPAYAIDPAYYFRLQRTLKNAPGMPEYVVSWPGALFTYCFSHCWIDYGRIGADDPAWFGETGPRVDWFENSRRAVLTHRQRCIEQASRFKTFAPDRWGLSACDGKDGYIVPEVQPNLSNADQWCEGTVAPYAAGSAIMFAPAQSLKALRAFRELKGPDGKPLVWRDPSTGGYGLADAFNLDQGFVSPDYIGIDHGPMLLAIENARTGLIWKLFGEHALAKRAMQRLKLIPPPIVHPSAGAFSQPSKP